MTEINKTPSFGIHVKQGDSSPILCSHRTSDGSDSDKTSSTMAAQYWTTTDMSGAGTPLTIDSSDAVNGNFIITGFSALGIGTYYAHYTETISGSTLTKFDLQIRVSDTYGSGGGKLKKSPSNIVLKDETTQIIINELGATISGGGGGADADAIHDNVSGEIAAITEKVTPVSADILLIEDSAASNVKKRVQVGNLPGGGGGDAWSDPVDAVITPDADGTRDLGTTGTRFATGYLDNLDVTNNIVVGGTVDGRDISADGTKLDGIEASATADQTGAEIKAAYEAEADTNAFTDADHSKLDGIEASADVTDATNVTASGAVMADGSGNDITGDLVFTEKADHSSTPAAGKGYFWVKNTTPSTPIFTDDAGSDTTLGSGGGIADESVTNPKLAHINQYEVKGRVSAGAGDVEDLTPAQQRQAAFRDTADNTKTISFDLSGITTGTDRAWTAPDVAIDFDPVTHLSQMYAALPAFSETINNWGDYFIVFNASTGLLEKAFTGEIVSKTPRRYVDTAAYTIVTGDRGHLITVNYAGTCTISIDTNANQQIPNNTKIYIQSLTDNDVFIDAVTPGTTTLEYNSTLYQLKTIGKLTPYIVLDFYDTDVIHISGGLAPA